ncbi:alpha/beta fold hydrolase [Limnobacter humi]|uniref:Alpha/beta fold hydrolase n=1 Tax=Limnobacter humi TaxID=1778671 RepID=A0ABT1WD37_9BURK|nr:alpha/beta fold hydrolase [Limnobacter humi]
MKQLFKTALKINEIAANTATNAADWLFRKDILIQSGKTEYQVIAEEMPMRVRYYAPDANTPHASLVDGEEETPPQRQHPIPLVLVPPLGVTTETFDLMPDRSLVKHMVQAGFRVYLIDWGKPERKHAHLGLYDYSHDMMGSALQRIRQHSGSEEVSLFGWCMGGLLCLLYAGYGEDKAIRNLVTVASPIDLRNGKNIMSYASNTLNVIARFIRKYSEFRLDNINPALFSPPGWMVSLGFKLTAPVASITTYWDLLTRLSDRDYVEQHTTTADYLNNMMLYPGGVVRDFMVRFTVDNKLAKGAMKIGDKQTGLSNIQSNFLVFAGETDHLVPASMAKQSLKLVASKDKTFMLAPGGHMGVILGSKAVSHVWQLSAEWLRARSQVPLAAVKTAPAADAVSAKAKPKSRKRADSQKAA